MSRPSFRARPIDIHQSLAIIREVLDDEQAITREVNHAHKSLDKDNEEVRPARAGFRPGAGKHGLSLSPSVAGQNTSRIDAEASVQKIFFFPVSTPRLLRRPLTRIVRRTRRALDEADLGRH